MKKAVWVVTLAALLLTGCGSTASLAGSSSPDAESSSQAAAEQKEDSEPAESSETDEEAELYDWNGIDMPIPAGMEEHVRSRMKWLSCWFNGKDEEAVYYTFASAFYMDPKTVEEIPEKSIETMDKYFYAVFESDTLGNYSKVTADETSEEEFLGSPALCVKGTVTLNDKTKLNYIAHYAFLDFSESGDMNTPSFWMSFTPSDSKDALDRMEKAAALPLTQAKLHQS